MDPSANPLDISMVLNRFRVLDIDNKMCVCALCADGGDLVLCDGPSCPLVFHPPCLVASDIPDPTHLGDDVSWLCPRCDPTSTSNGLPYDSAICSFERIEKARKQSSPSHRVSDSDSQSPPLPPNSSEVDGRKRKRKATPFFSRSGDAVVEPRVSDIDGGALKREYRGLFREPKSWRVTLNHGKGKKLVVGRWFDEIEAAKAWDLSNLLLKGPLCKRMTLNFPDKLEEYDRQLRSGYQPDEHADIPAREKPQFPIYDTSERPVEPIRLQKVSDGISSKPTFAEFMAMSTKTSKGVNSGNSNKNLDTRITGSDTVIVDTGANFDRELDPLPTQFGDDSHLYYCRLCDNKGSDARLVLCESCPRVFHHRCVPTLRSISLSLTWHCPICISLGRGLTGSGLDFQHLSILSSESSQTQLENVSSAVSRSAQLLFREMRSRGSISATFEPSLRHIAVLVARAFSDDDSIAAECALSCQNIENDLVSSTVQSYLFSKSISISALCLEPLPSSDAAPEEISQDLELHISEDGVFSAFSDIVAKPVGTKIAPSHMEWDDLFEKEKEDVSLSGLDNQTEDKALSSFSDDFPKQTSHIFASPLTSQAFNDSTQQIGHTLVFEPDSDASTFLIDSAQTHTPLAPQCQYCRCIDPDAKCTTCLKSFHLKCDEESRFADHSPPHSTLQGNESNSQSFEEKISVANLGPVSCTACLIRLRLVRLIQSERSALLKDTSEFLASNAPWRTVELSRERCAYVAEQASRSISNRAYRLSCLRALWAIIGAAATDRGQIETSSLVRFGDAFPFLILPPPTHAESKSFFLAAGGSAELGNFSSYSIMLDRLVSGVYDVDPSESRIFAQSPTKNSRVRAQVQASVAAIDLAHKSPASVMRLPSIQLFVRDLSIISCNAASHFGKQESVWDSSSIRHKRIGANAPLVHHATVVALESALLSGACTVLSATIAALSGLQNKDGRTNFGFGESVVDSTFSQVSEDSFVKNLAVSFTNEILAVSKEVGEQYKRLEDKSSLRRQPEILPVVETSVDFDTIAQCVHGEFIDAITMVQSRKKQRMLVENVSDEKTSTEHSHSLIATQGTTVKLNVRLVLKSKEEEEEVHVDTPLTHSGIMEQMETLLLSHIKENSEHDVSAIEQDDEVQTEENVSPEESISLRPNDFDWQLAAQLRDTGVSLEASIAMAEGFIKKGKTDVAAKFVSPIDEAFLNLAFPVQSSQTLGLQIIPGRGPSRLVPGLSGDFITCKPFEDKINNSSSFISLLLPQKTLESTPMAVFHGDPLRCDGCRYGWLHICSFSGERLPLNIEGRVHSALTDSIPLQSSPVHEVILSSLLYSQEDGLELPYSEEETEARVRQSDVDELRASFLRLLALHNHRLLTTSPGSSENLSKPTLLLAGSEDYVRERRYQLERERKLASISALQLQLSVLGPRETRREMLGLMNKSEQNDDSSLLLQETLSVEETGLQSHKLGPILQKDSIKSLSLFQTDSVVATQILASANIATSLEARNCKSLYLSEQLRLSEVFRETSNPDILSLQSNNSENELMLPGTEDAFHLSAALNETTDRVKGSVYTQSILYGALRQWRRAISLGLVHNLSESNYSKSSNGCARLRPYIGKRRFFPRMINAKEFYSMGASTGPLGASSPGSLIIKEKTPLNHSDTPLQQRSLNDDGLENDHLRWLTEEQPSMKSLETRARWSLKTRLALGTSRIDGLGLFAREVIESDDVIIEYTGEVISDSICNIRQKMYESKGLADFMFRTSDNEVIDATVHGCRARYINHSCDPNCFAVVTFPEFSQIKLGRRVFIYSKRRIYKGEELTYDYCFGADEKSVRCFCGQSACRGRLNIT